jgi:purine-binding chemotaxis protein CheW
VTAGHADASSLQIVVFSLRGENYALPIADVSEIIRYTPRRSISSDAPWIRGIISLRGKVIPVFDLASCLGLAAAGEPAKIIVIESHTGHLGVMVDELDEVLSISGEQIEAPPAGAGGGNETFVKLGDRLVILLDAPHLLTGSEPSAVLPAG